MQIDKDISRVCPLKCCGTEIAGDVYDLIIKLDAIIAYSSGCCIKTIAKEIDFIYSIWQVPVGAQCDIFFYIDFEAHRSADMFSLGKVQKSIRSTMLKAAKICKRNNWKKVLIIADDLNLKKCIEIAKSLGLDATSEKELLKIPQIPLSIQCESRDVSALLKSIRRATREILPQINPLRVLLLIFGFFSWEICRYGWTHRPRQLFNYCYSFVRRP